MSYELQSFTRLRDEDPDDKSSRSRSRAGSEVSASASASAADRFSKAAQLDAAHYTYVKREPLHPGGKNGNGSSGSSMGADSDMRTVQISEEDNKEYSERRGRKTESQTDSQGNIVVATNIHKTYLLGIEGVPALRGVSLNIKKGEFIMILGASGGGKTSLLNILGTIDKPTKGELHICGHRITSLTTDEEFALLRLKKIGFVFQTFNLIPSMTAEENVSLPMILEGRLSSKEISARAVELLDRVGLADRKDHLPSQLSGGEAQRTTIARAIANRPSILLLDEPTGDLDTVNSALILSLLLHLNRREGITCIMVTHDTALKHYAHRVVHMVDGKVARLESISSEVRAEMDRALLAKVEAIRSEWNSEVEHTTEATTEYREHHDYEDYLRTDDEDED